MGLLRETALLGSETITIWLRTFTRMTFWCAVGLTGQLLGLYGSAWLGSAQQVLSMVVFIAGELVLIIGFVMMLYSAHNELQSPKQLRQHPHPSVPQTVFDPGRPADAMLVAVGPFLVVYATWQLVEEQIQTLFSTNIVLNGLETDLWSVGFDRWKFYLTVAAIIFVAKQVVEQLGQRLFGRSRILLGATMLLEAGWIFATFIGLDTVRAKIATWFLTRKFWTDTTTAWYDFLASLPNVHVPLIGPLPEFLRQAWQWMGQTFIPGIWDWAVLPLFWLALAAVVHGWRDFSVRAVLTGRPAKHLERTEHGVLAVVTKDVREKYLPVLRSVRLMVAAGPYFVAAYLMLSALLQVVFEWLPMVLIGIASAPDLAWYMSVNAPLAAVGELLVHPLLFSLYLAAFDRAIADTTGSHWRARRLRRATWAGDVTARRALGAPQTAAPRPTAE